MLILVMVMSFGFAGCLEDGSPDDQKIEETADKAKDFLDKFAAKAKDVLDNKDGQLDKAKDLIDQIAEKSKDVAEQVKEKGPEWKEQLEKLKNDPKLKETIENFKGDAGDLFKELEKIVTDAAKDMKENAGAESESGKGAAEKLKDSGFIKKGKEAVKEI